MIIYVAHEYGGDKKNIELAAEKTRRLQLDDPDNTYICPLLIFAYLEYGEIGYDDEIEHCLEVLRKCDALLIASNVSRGIELEILEAKELNIAIYFDDDTK